MEKEIWKDIPNYEGIYQASNLGKIKNIKRNKILKPYLNKKTNYMYSHLCKNGIAEVRRTHRIIATTFISNPKNKPYINHKNGIKTDNRAENLEWCTAKENSIHAWKTGLCKVTEEQRKARSEYCKTMRIKKVAQYDKNMRLIKIWKSQTHASEKTNISKTSINNNVRGLSKSAGGYIWVKI